jgi:hypothetical protein
MSIEDDVKIRFDQVVTEHEMTVLQDDGGVYRHLRFRHPGTVIYSFNLITWPGHLAIAGDCGAFMFARTHDMFEFFEASTNGAINPHYWSEKLTAPRQHGVRKVRRDRAVYDYQFLWCCHAIVWGIAKYREAQG